MDGDLNNLLRIAARTMEEGLAVSSKSDRQLCREHDMGENVEEGEQSSSRPPTPEDSLPGTPRVTIDPCPIRLWPSFPPKNYGTVVKGYVFRSGFPEDRNVEFLGIIGVRTILSLVTHPFSEESKSQKVADFVIDWNVNHMTIPLDRNKKGKSATKLEDMYKVVMAVLDPTNYPIYIHCNQGKHRTGCAVACARRVQKWPIEDIIREYETYAGDKAKSEDVEFIKAFDPSNARQYAQEHGAPTDWPRVKRTDSAASLRALTSVSPTPELSETQDSSGPEDNSTETQSKIINPVLLDRSAPADGWDDGDRLLSRTSAGQASDETQMTGFSEAPASDPIDQGADTVAFAASQPQIIAVSPPSTRVR